MDTATVAAGQQTSSASTTVSQEGNKSESSSLLLKDTKESCSSTSSTTTSDKGDRMVQLELDKDEELLSVSRKGRVSVSGGSTSGSGSGDVHNHHQQPFHHNQHHHQHPQTTPNHIVYKKMEKMIDRMQEESSGVPVRTVKSFLTKIPSVFTGSDIICWITRHMDVDDIGEALHLACLLSSHGYIFPIDDHVLSVKNDSTFYRFQTPYFWPSNYWDPENSDYAVYLCKRTMQNKTRLELTDYEAENLARLQKMFSRKWEFIFMQAEAQSKVDKKRDKLERKVLDSQERAFWDVHRPAPGCVSTTELDIKKVCRMNRPTPAPSTAASSRPSGSANPVSGSSTSSPAAGATAGTSAAAAPDPPPTPKQILQTEAELTKQIKSLKYKLDRHSIKVSKVAEMHLGYYDMYCEYDPAIISPEPSNPWLSDSIDFWDQERVAKEIPARRVKRWGFAVEELLKDPVGREHFAKFLEKEFSVENLRFWEAVQELKRLPMCQVPKRAEAIWTEFLAPDSTCLVNVDSHSYEHTKRNIQNGHPDRWSFDTALAHVYHLMKSDSYSRYIRSDMYKDFLSGAKKKVNFLSLPQKFRVK